MYTCALVDGTSSRPTRAGFIADAISGEWRTDKCRRSKNKVEANKGEEEELKRRGEGELRDFTKQTNKKQISDNAVLRSFSLLSCQLSSSCGTVKGESPTSTTPSFRYSLFVVALSSVLNFCTRLPSCPRRTRRSVCVCCVCVCVVTSKLKTHRKPATRRQSINNKKQNRVRYSRYNPHFLFLP
jgi:hypothetical protein